MTNDKIDELLEMFAVCKKHGDTYDYPVPRYEKDFHAIVAQWVAGQSQPAISLLKEINEYLSRSHNERICSQSAIHRKVSEFLAEQEPPR